MIATITGKNTFAANRELTSLRQKFIDEYGESGVVELSGDTATIDNITQSVMSQGLFSSNSFVLLRDVAKNKFLQEGLEGILESVPSEAQLIIFDTSLDRRTSFFKSLKKHTHLTDCTPLDERLLAQWARDEFSAMGGELGFSEAQHLVNRVNLDQWLLYNELQKLINVESKITREIINNMVDESFNESIFNLLDDAFAGRVDRALDAYRDMLANRVEAHYVFSMLIWQLHILLLVAYGDNRPPDEIAKDNKVSPFVVKKSKSLFQKTSKQKLREIVEYAAQVDSDSKTKAAYNMDAAVDVLIARIASD